MAEIIRQSNHGRVWFCCRHSIVWSVALLLAAVWPVSAAQAADESLVTVEDRIWGFDGRVHVGQFNPVSILIDNRSEEAIDVQATFSRMEPLAGSTGGSQQQPVFIGPGARRWVQFYAYIPADDRMEWQLKLGKYRFPPLQQPRSTMAKDGLPKGQQPQPAVMILDPAGAMNLKPTSVRHFPESIFPPYATATAGLHTVFMDRAPDWEVPRQQALLSWLRRGGKLRLLRTSRGQWPEFTGLLAELSQPLPRFSVGSGEVQRLDLQRSDLSPAIVRGLLPSRTTEDDDGLPEENLAANSNPYQNVQNMYGFNSSLLDEEWLQQMRQLTQPEHAWWLIYLLAFLYIGLIFPGCWILARQKRHFLVVYGSIAGLSVLFSLLFLVIGRRGHGETTSLHTLAISRIEGGGQSGLQQSLLEWDALFVTDGGEYSVTSPDQQQLFAITGLTQRTEATMTAGNDGQLLVDIPPFSSQPFICRRQLAAPDWQLQVSEFARTPGGQVTIRIRSGEAFQPGSGAMIRVLHGARMFRMEYDAEQSLLTNTGRITTLRRFYRQYQNSDSMGQGFGYAGEVDAATFYKSVEPGLVIRSLVDEGVADPGRVQLPADRLRLFVYTDVPPDQFLTTNSTPRNNGRILYICDLPLSSAALLSTTASDSSAAEATENSAAESESESIESPSE